MSGKVPGQPIILAVPLLPSALAGSGQVVQTDAAEPGGQDVGIVDEAMNIPPMTRPEGEMQPSSS